MFQWLKDSLHEHSERHRYYRRMADKPIDYIILPIVFLIVMISEKLNFFPTFFRIIAICIWIPCVIWKLFIWAGAKHRPEDWDN